MTSKDIAMKLRKGDLDCNSRGAFFSAVIKGLIKNLNKDIYIRNLQVPHIILHTGDEQMFLNVKGQDMNIEPYEVSNEDYVYNTIPRCIVTPGEVSLIPDQITNPYSRGVFQYETEDSIYTLSAEFRRMPIKISIDLKYYVSTYTDLLDLTQSLVANTSFIRTYNISYLGQVIKCSYKTPEAFNGEKLTELDETLQDNRNKTLSINLEVESNFPIFERRTVISTDNVISKTVNNINIKNTNEIV